MKKNFILYILLIGCIFSFQSTFAQAGSGEMLRGKVVAADTGEELISATVVELSEDDRVVGHTLTDINGDFSLKLYSSRNKLRVSYLGFKEQRLSIGTRRSFNVVLQEDNNIMDEVVIVRQRTSSDGTMNIPESEISYAMQKINTKDFEGIQAASIDDLLQGQIAGLDIIGSGDLGRKSSMRIRGTASINANVEPLIVMNGIPREDINVSESGVDLATANEDQFADLLSVNPDDILEITVLKDAASTAVWGSKGANGVLMITTKKGSAGPTRVNYTYKLSGAWQPEGLKMLNGDDYTMMMKQALFNAYMDTGSSTVQTYLNADQLNYRGDDYTYYSNNTNWRKAVTQTGYTHDHYLAISGGGEKATFRVTGGYMTQRGTVLGQGLDRLTSRIDLDYYVSSRIKFSSEFSFTYTDNDRNFTDATVTNGSGYNILDLAYKKMPNLAIYNRDRESYRNLDTYYNIPNDYQLGSQMDYRNPVALAKLATNKLQTYNVQPVLRLRYDLLDPANQMLQYNVWVSFQMRNERTRKYLPKEVSSRAMNDEYINRSSSDDSENFNVQTENSLQWQPKFENTDHSLTVYGALQTTSGTSNSQNIVSYGYPSSLITDPTAEAYLHEVKSSLGQFRSMGIISRAHYAYKGKYILGLTFRRDGSTKFGKENKYGNFPGISLRWNISDEPFMDFSNEWLDMLSIRPSWGITGNEPKYDYLHFSKYKPGSSNYAGAGTVYPENIRLSNLKWEKTTGWNLGFDFAVLNYTYNMDINLYHQRTQDMLFENTKIPTSSGFSGLPYRNGGTMDNDGWELNFNANRFIKFGDFSFDFRFNLANSVNTLVKLDDDIINTYNLDFEYKNKAAYLQRLQEDKSYGSIYGFKYKGVYDYGIDNYERNGTSPVVRDKDGNVMLDNYGKPIPMYFNYYGLNGATNYQFRAGDAIYEDINGDGTIDEYDIVYLGNSSPLINGGVGFTVRWKQLSANFFANFRYGNKVINRARMEAESMDSYDNQSIAVNWRWRKEPNDDEISRPQMLPRAVYDISNNVFNSLPSDRYVEDGSFFRLKYITLSYAVPSASLKKYGMRQLSLYLTINNLFCWTKYTGVDPEISYSGLGISEDKSTTPRSKDFTFSVSVGF